MREMKVSVSVMPKVKQKETLQFSAGLYYKSTDGLIVLSTGSKSESYFSGVVVSSEDIEYRKPGDYSDGWIKDFFEPFEGQIVINQD